MNILTQHSALRTTPKFIYFIIRNSFFLSVLSFTSRFLFRATPYGHMCIYIEIGECSLLKPIEHWTLNTQQIKYLFDFLVSLLAIKWFWLTSKFEPLSCHRIFSFNDFIFSKNSAATKWKSKPKNPNQIHFLNVNSDFSVDDAMNVYR